METIYLIRQTESTPWESKIYGYIKNVSEDEAMEVVENLNKYKGGKSLGWDNKMYPVFELEKVNEVSFESCKVIEEKRTNKSYKIKFRTINELAETLTSMGLKDQFHIAGEDEQYPGEMTFKVGDYVMSNYSYSKGIDRTAVVSELHDGNYLIYEGA